MTTTYYLFDGTGTVTTGAASGLTVVTPGSGTMTYDTVSPFQGTSSMKVVTVSGGATYGQASPFASPKLSTSFFLKIDSIPANDMWVEAVFDATPVTPGTVCKVLVSATGRLRFQLSAATNLYTAATALALNTWYRVDLYIDRGASAGAGTVKLDYYLANASSPVEAGYSVVGSAALGSVDFDIVRIGKGNASTGASILWYDAMRIDPAVTAQLGVYTDPNTAPVVGAGVDITDAEPWTTVTLEGTATDADGTIVTGPTWTQTAGTTVTLGGSGLTRTFEAPASLAGETLTFQLSATDDDGATSTDSIDVTVLPATEFTYVSGVLVPVQLVAAS